MKDIDKFISILKNQNISNDWEKIDYEIIVEHEENCDINVKIVSEQIGFVFSKEGRFKGIYNWKW